MFWNVWTRNEYITHSHPKSMHTVPLDDKIQQYKRQMYHHNELATHSQLSFGTCSINSHNSAMTSIQLFSLPWRCWLGDRKGICPTEKLASVIPWDLSGFSFGKPPTVEQLQTNTESICVCITLACECVRETQITPSFTLACVCVRETKIIPSFTLACVCVREIKIIPSFTLACECVWERQRSYLVSL